MKFVDELDASGGAPVGNCVIAGKVCPKADAATNRSTTQIFCMRKVSHKTRYIPPLGILFRDAAVSSESSNIVGL